MLISSVRHFSKLASGKYLYRRGVPKAMRPFLGKREFKKILGNSEREAMQGYQRYHLYVENTLKTLKVLGPSSPNSPFEKVMVAYDALALDQFTEGNEGKADAKALYVEQLIQPYIEHEARSDGYHVTYDNVPEFNENLARLIINGESIANDIFKVSDAFDVYLKDKQKPAGVQRKKQLHRFSLVQRVLLEVVGADMAVVSLRRKHAKEVRDLFLSQGMQSATVNRYLADIRAVLTYATRESDIPYTNPFAAVSFEIDVSENRQREPLPDHVADLVIDDLEARKNQDLFDLIRLLDLTGGRLAEISCLRQDEVFLEVPIPYIDIKQRSDRRLKNDWSVRAVPLTTTAQAAARSALERHSGKDYLFPVFDKPRGADNASARLNKAIKKYRTSSKQVAHSMRLGFRDRIRNNAIPLELANAIEGRRYSLGEELRYSGGYNLEQKLEAMRKTNGEE